MTLSERYKNRKTLKEADGPAGAPSNPPSPKDTDPKEKLEELRDQVKSFGKSIKIKSIQQKFGEKLKEITASMANWSQIDLNEEWDKLSPMLDEFVGEAKKVTWYGEDGKQLEDFPEHIKKFVEVDEGIENKIKNFNDKKSLEDFFTILKKEEEWFAWAIEESIVRGDKFSPQAVKFMNSVKKFHKSLSSFVDDFEKRAKFDPAKIIKEVETLIAQTKKSMTALGEFLKNGNYVTDENKGKPLGDILKPAEPAGGVSAPGAAAAGGGAA